MAREISERTLLIVFVPLFLLVIVTASWAIRSSRAPEQVPLEALPLATQVMYGHPSPSICEAAGGAVRYERVTECFSGPGVHDACEFPGVLCFTGGDGSVCREARAPYCACEGADDCPDRMVCQGPQVGETRCVPSPSYPYPKPYPIY
ncbi:hypothetical protein A2856_03280 [Candidatus Uhrbacteria bacterium RIFCSPHIGHO2_01_FULL_63_20]|uniref:Uncharacterized protein n=1 Tax=Candidatus Uhrbacteria bacterium RIFCSPHIGHO2_01_FULL_63_20 TaxID=1802385 RepID=A0A1F7TLA8_9BACT|nr:MAG: hypothetical protein A2856_03280 [Candidatus Uhrbacteria bacterium RIFCSPHIGHO2_01_FULL_63_20]